ncbi:MAG: ABC transporter permease subunit [Oscillospiraceae bacterium]|nr:ABC transporter permease subunit [Oscillospiraceae bacterium]
MRLTRRFGQNLWRYRTLTLMCLPVVVFFFMFSYMPMPGAYVAFTKFNYQKGIWGSQYIGWKNFQFLFTSGQLALLLRNTVLYNIAFIVIGNVVQMTVAILMNEVRSAKFRKVTQTIMFLPYFISAVLVALVVYNLLNFDFGFITSLLRQWNLPAPKVYSTPNAWPVLIIIVHLWQSTGYGSVVYFAAIMGIDAEMMEAARVDGANGWQRILHITLPCLKPTFVLLLLFALGGIIRGNFGLFYNLVGLNSMLYRTTDIIETYVYRSMMNNFNFSQSSAVGLFQSVVGFAIVVIVNALVKKIEPDNSLF